MMDAREITYWAAIANIPELKEGANIATKLKNYRRMREHLVDFHGFSHKRLQFPELNLDVRLKRHEFYLEKEVDDPEATIDFLHQQFDEHPGNEYTLHEGTLGYCGHIVAPRDLIKVDYSIVLFKRGLDPQTKRKVLAYEHGHFLDYSDRRIHLIGRTGLNKADFDAIRGVDFAQLCIRIANT